MLGRMVMGTGDHHEMLMDSKTVLSPILPLHDLPPKRPHGMIRMQACIRMNMRMVAWMRLNGFNGVMQK